MKISWHGGSSVSLEHEGATIFIGTPQENIKSLKSLDVCVSVNPTHYGKELSSDVLFIQTPGEYENKGFFFEVAATPRPPAWNNAVLIFNKTMELCHLGAMNEYKLTKKILDSISILHILLLPIGNKEGMSVKDALKALHELEPLIVVPMWVDKTKQEQDRIRQQFIKEVGTDIEKANTYTLQKKDLEPSTNMRTLILKEIPL